MLCKEASSPDSYLTARRFSPSAPPSPRTLAATPGLGPAVLASSATLHRHSRPDLLLHRSTLLPSKDVLEHKGRGPDVLGLTPLHPASYTSTEVGFAFGALAGFGSRSQLHGSIPFAQCMASARAVPTKKAGQAEPYRSPPWPAYAELTKDGGVSTPTTTLSCSCDQRRTHNAPIDQKMSRAYR